MRGLAWAQKSIQQNTAKPANINLINLEIGDFYKSIFVRCASCKTTPVPQKGSSKTPDLAPLVARFMRIWASFGGSMPTKASRAGRAWSR